ncbi:MAG: protein-methionine-sulfoxide reductase catalytic subunit MsrP [Xanthomonadales bacterium]|nr:protein-methionine-sulfoxide reductase catalytic subunit MsrP [Xanthomonadales bacterium]
MLIRQPPAVPSSEITDESVYLQRRDFLRRAGLAGAGLALSPSLAAQLTALEGDTAPLEGVRPSPLSTTQPPNSWEDITTYNNFYEFGTGKGDPARNSGDFRPRPWTVQVSGECDKPGTYHLEDLLAPHALEERIYRLRCVEAWSMVVPWAGIPLGDMLKRFQPNSRAKFVRFKTVLRPEEMPGQRRSILPWPYVEGLTIAEAMHPLAIMAVGLYGRLLPNQNGAPMRLMVPWKYGFKNIKSVDSIEFVERQPISSWERAIPSEYGFYANVNPEVNHPRWSQATERPIGAGLFADRVPTRMFNGYADQVAHLYQGLDLRRNF